MTYKGKINSESSLPVAEQAHVKLLKNHVVRISSPVAFSGSV
jgi:hypothetical protein